MFLSLWGSGELSANALRTKVQVLLIPFNGSGLFLYHVTCEFKYNYREKVSCQVGILVVQW